MNISSLSIGELHKLADTTRREIEGLKLTANIDVLGEAKAHLTAIESKINRRKENP
jgi:hypothetical protein